MMSLLLSTNSISKSYGPLHILRDISLSVEAGDAIAITGPSGSGKSTLLHILGTLDDPTSGSLEICGQDPAGLTDVDLSKFRNETLGFVFQDAHLLPQFSVTENVLIPARAFGSITPDKVSRCEDLLKEVGLSDRSGHLPSQLSGGERQRAAIARALVMEPKLLLCDEPTGNLDSATAEQIANVLLAFGTASGRALIVITHSDTLAGRMSRQLTLRDGQCSEV
jgi:lipoprotein-releasing system ATP-binding protein